MRRGPLIVVVAFGLGLAPRPAPAAPAPVTSSVAGARVDWTAGTVAARGAGAGDLRAPSAAVARVGAQRKARAAAREVLRRAVGELPLADGRTVSAAVAGDAAALARLDEVVAGSRSRNLRYSTDGSVTLTEVIGVDAVRWAVYGPQAPPPGGGPSAVIVRVPRGFTAPVVGLSVDAGGNRYRGPVVYLRASDAAARDPRLGGDVVRARARAARDGALVLGAGSADTVAKLGRSGALVVVVLPGKQT